MTESEGDTGDHRDKLLVDGMLSSIMKSLSRSPKIPDLVSAIERDCSDLEVKSSWTKLFDRFDEAFDAALKKKVKDIKRLTKRSRIEDIVGQLGKLDRLSEAEFLVMPWNYIMKTFETDSEKLAKAMTEENSKDFDARLNALDKKMEKKHSELIETVQNMLQGAFAVQTKPVSNTSFADIVSRGQGGHPEAIAAHVQGGPHQAWQGSHRARGRSVSPSVKRPRTDNDVTEAGGEHQKSRERFSAKPKPVIGTSDSARTGRKMRSPPADIFVWGVHPETTVEDIVNDLASSDIIIKESDVLKKSKEEAYLCSYKISVPAADLQKALDPAIWPLRVKVREFIHYSRRNPRQQNSTTGGHAQSPLGGQVHAGVGGQGQADTQDQHGGASGRVQSPLGGQVHAGVVRQGQVDVRDAQDQQQAKSNTLQIPTIELNNKFSALTAASSL